MDKSFLSFPLSFSIAEKETKKLDKNMLPHTCQGWPAFLSGQHEVLMEYWLPYQVDALHDNSECHSVGIPFPRQPRLLMEYLLQFKGDALHDKLHKNQVML